MAPLGNGVVGEVLADDAAKVGETNLGSLGAGIFAFHHRELELDVGAVACFLGLQVPLAFVGAAVGTPAKTNGAVGQHHLAVSFQGDGFPLGVVGRRRACR